MKSLFHMMLCLCLLSVFVTLIRANHPMTLKYDFPNQGPSILDPGFVREQFHPPENSYPQPLLPPSQLWDHFGNPTYPAPPAATLPPYPEHPKDSFGNPLYPLPPPAALPPYPEHPKDSFGNPIYPVPPPVLYPTINPSYPAYPTIPAPPSEPSYIPNPIYPADPSLPNVISPNHDFGFLEKSGFDGGGNFSKKFYQKVAQTTVGNLVVSSFSAYLALLMASYGARGNTERQMVQVLNRPRIDVIQNVFPKALNLLKELGDDSEININNAIYVTKRAGTLERFKQTVKSMFQSGVVEIDTRNLNQAALQINNWVDEQTNHKIRDIVTPNDLQGGDIFLINTIYLRSSWAEKFNNYLTELKPFYGLYGNTKFVSTMSVFRVHFDTGYLPELNARFVILPYKAPGLEMIVVIPNEVKGLPTIENQISYLDNDIISQRRTNTHVNLEMPKFRVESHIYLKDVLLDLGMSDAFFAGADFSGMSANNVAIGDVIQKTYIDVDEKGTEAAAATAVIVPQTISAFIHPEEKEPELIKVNRPSYFMINYRNINLFSGRIDP